MSRVLHLSLAIDESGRPRGTWVGTDEVPRDATAFTDFLATDIGENHDYCARILEEARRLGQGGHVSWHVTGNAFALTVGPDKATIKALFPPDDPDPAVCALPTSELVEVIARWQHLLQNDQTAAS